MKFLKQFGIIILISFAGEVIKYFIPLPIPSSIYGIIIMFILLKTKILPLDSIKDTGKFLIEIMPLMFIPAAVGLVDSWKILQPVLISVLTITIISTIVVMAVTGKVTQAIIHFQKKIKNNKRKQIK